MPTVRSITLSVSIERDWHDVYDFAADPTNLRLWAAGLSTDFERDGDDWVLSDQGGKPVRMRFSPRNSYGVLDHDLLVGHESIHVAMRVMPNGDGAEVTFLLLQAPNQSDAEYDRDAAAVRKDLASLKSLLEKP